MKFSNFCLAIFLCWIIDHVNFGEALSTRSLTTSLSVGEKGQSAGGFLKQTFRRITKGVKKVVHGVGQAKTQLARSIRVSSYEPQEVENIYKIFEAVEAVEGLEVDKYIPSPKLGELNKFVKNVVPRFNKDPKTNSKERQRINRQQYDLNGFKKLVNEAEKDLRLGVRNAFGEEPDVPPGLAPHERLIVLMLHRLMLEVVRTMLQNLEKAQIELSGTKQPHSGPCANKNSKFWKRSAPGTKFKTSINGLFTLQFEREINQKNFQLFMHDLVTPLLPSIRTPNES